MSNIKPHTMKELTTSDFRVLRMENPRRKDKNVLTIVDKVSHSSNIIITPRNAWITTCGMQMIQLLTEDDKKMLINLRKCPRMENNTYYELTDVLNLDFSKGQKVNVLCCSF